MSTTKRILRGDVGQLFNAAIALLLFSSFRCSADIRLRAPIGVYFNGFLSNLWIFLHVL
jgi:hypothetical protein